MKKNCCLFCFLSVSFMAVAGTPYVWRGGATGDWGTPENWYPAGSPNAGDTVTFSSAATVSGTLVLSDGILTVNVATKGQKVTFENLAISGTGGIAKDGPGNFMLTGENSFSGGFTLLDRASSDWEYTQLVGPKAAGTGEIVHGASSSSCTAALYIEAPAEGMTIANDVDLGWGQSARVIVSGGPVVFSGKVGHPGRIRVEGSGEGSHVYFSGSLSNRNTNAEFKNGHFHFQCPADLVVFTPAANAVSHFEVAGSKVWRFLPEGTVEFLAENAMPSVSQYLKFAAGTVLKLNGYSQVAKPNQTQDGVYFSSASTTHRIDSPLGRRANFSMSVNNGTDECYRGQLTGSAGLTWAPRGTPHELAVSGVISDTYGDLIVSAGTMRLTSGTAFSGLHSIETAAGATFVVDATAGDVCVSEVLIADEETGLSIAENRTITCSTATIGNRPLSVGSHVMPGGGTLVVDGHPVNIWLGGVDRDWNNPENWLRKEVPGAGEKVIVDGDITFDLAETTPRYHEIALTGGATLRFSGWDGVLQADAVTVGNGGLITTVGAFTNETDKSRVFISCGDLTVNEGGAIDVTAKGWHGGWSGHETGYGPGGGVDANHGASHGGLAGFEVAASLAAQTGVYGDPLAPVEPGSGAGGKANFTPAALEWNVGGNGGGAIRIAATGAVVVNGSVLADAQAANAASRLDSRGGAGGSIWISCASFAGTNGRVSAKGGDTQQTRCPSWAWDDLPNVGMTSMTGGGGRIRIEYSDDAAQAAAVLSGMTVSAAAGNMTGVANSSPAYVCRLSAATRDRYRGEADLGTVTFSGRILVDKLLGKGLSGRLLGFGDYVYAEDLEWTDGHVRFADEGANVTFEKSLTLLNDSSRLEIGGVSVSVNQSIVFNVQAGAELNRLHVKGDFTVSNGAAFDIRAAATNETMRWGGEVRVDGDFTVGANAIVHPWCDVRNLGAAHFAVGGNFTLSETGTIDADRRGGAQGWNSATLNSFMLADIDPPRFANHSYGFGVGGSLRAAGHGGLGGLWVEAADDGSGSYATNATSRGVVLGDEWTAELPGAGGGSSSYCEGGEGGGLVCLECAGDVSVNGRISADGFHTVSYYRHQFSHNYCGAGAGGSIRLVGKTVSLGNTSELSVRGGAALVAMGVNGAYVGFVYGTPGGGGGRIVLGSGGDVLLVAEKHKMRRHGVAPSGISVDDAAVLSVAGGENKWTSDYSARPMSTWPSLTYACGEPGTIRYVSYEPKPGSLIFIQ